MGLGCLMLRRFSVNFSIFSMALDAVLSATLLLTAAQLRPLLSALPFAADFRRPASIPPALYLVFPLVWVLILSLFSVYDGRRNLHVVNEMSSLTFGSLLSGVALAGVLYLSYRDISRAQFIFYILLTYSALMLWRLIVRGIRRLMRVNSMSLRRVLIAGAGLVGNEVQAQIAGHPYFGLTLVGFLDDACEKYAGDAKMLGTLDDAHAVIHELKVDDVVIALPTRAHERVNQLVAELHDLPVRVWIIPDYFHLALHKAVVDDFAGLPMLDLRAPALSDSQRFIKRLFDLTLTIPGLIFALPVMGIITLAIYLDDGRPAIFRQTRAGENGKQFEMIKFRTMVRNAEALRDTVTHMDQNGNIIHKTPNDPRVTRIGRVLRRLSLDELPQLFNVLKGEMSLVGPRPEQPFLVEKYQPWQRKRFAIPQGLTGWWQVNGRSDKPMHLHTEDDLYYVQNYSLWLDIQILFLTFWIALFGKGAY